MACKAPENGFYPPCRENHRESRNLLQIGWLWGNKKAVKGVVLDGSCVNGWSEQGDSNPRPTGPKPVALPSCAMLRVAALNIARSC